MSAPISAFPFAPKTPPITLAAAAEAAAGGGGKRKSLRDRSILRLAKKSRLMADEFREKMEKSVKKKLNNMSGPDDNRKRGLKVAQFVPGKGLEIGGVQEHTDASIYCSLGLKGDKLENALEKTFETISGKKISMDFAFKLICKPDLSSKDKKSRVTALNCFRHVNPDSYNYKMTGAYESPTSSDQIKANKNWHTTLGPDASYIRRGPEGLEDTGVRAGTWRGGSDIGGLAKYWDGTYWQVNVGTSRVANSLYSPYRYPNDMEIMYSRINRQVLENYGFSLNKWRFRMSHISNTAETFDLASTTAALLWRGPGAGLMNFPDTANTLNDDLKASFPAIINTNFISKDTGVSTSQAGNKPDIYEYHSQFGPGKLNYQFSNDGTNPVCIDICVVGVKKSERASVNTLKQLFSYNYNLQKFTNNRGVNVGGYSAPKRPLGSGIGNEEIDFDFGNEEWHTDAKLPFIPNECFKNPPSYLKAVPAPGSEYHSSLMYNALEQGRKNPFKLIKRDQFIVSSGSTRAWNTTLPSIKYRPQLYENISYPTIEASNNVHEIDTTADEYTFILLIGACGMSKPMEELYPAQTENELGEIRTPEILKSTISDHEPSSCNVSVVGTYTETCMPAYPVDLSDKVFINGRLALPYFTEDTASDKINPSTITDPEYPDRLSTVDIATQMQVVRTTDSGISGVGAINTDVGA